MKEQNETFPTGVEAVFLIVGLFVAEYVIAALLHDIKSFSGVNPRDVMGVIALLGNGVLFVVLLHYKRLSYALLFHSSMTSVVATIGTLAIPVLLIVPGLTLLVWTVQAVLEAMFPLSNWQIAMFEQMMSNGVATVVTVCILAPVLEEMLFRGIILRSFLRQYSRKRAIIGSAVLFGLAHLNIYQFAVGVIFGVVLGWLYDRTRSLWPCILLHATYNSAVTAIYFTFTSQGAGDVWRPSIPYWATAFTLTFIGASLLHRLLVPRKVAP